MDQGFGSEHDTGVAGQVGVGVLLGAVWSPCVGPTLGAGSLLAAQRQDLAQVAVTMFSFGGSSIRHLYRPYSQGREPSRPASPPADQVRVRYQPANRQADRPYRATVAARPR
jgi:Cytochrome C biogenesis protein transmembrane region